MTKPMKPLEGIKILDVTAFLSGPFCTTMLGAMGADVILVERPKEGDPVRKSVPFAGPQGIHYNRQSPDDIAVSTLHRHRNKRGITVNLKSDEGKEIIRQLVRKMDIVVENFTPGVMDRLGLGYHALRAVNPGIIYCAISGFGQTGPSHGMRAYNITAQAMSGAMHVTGFPDGPPTKCGLTIGDYVAALYAIGAILAAVHYREKTGKGQQIDISMQDALFSLLMDWLSMATVGKMPMRKGNSSPRAIPTNCFQTRDGYVVLGVYSDEQWQKLCKAIGREDLLGDEKFDAYGARLENEQAVNTIINEWTRAQSTEDAVAQISKYNVACSPVKTVEALLTDEHILHREMYVDLLHPEFGAIEGLKGVGIPMKFSETPAAFDKPAPKLGQHTEEILTEYLGYSKAQIDKLKTMGAI